ncbi:MAG: uroporphyrinogen decarboxylase family protein [Actinomycetota bacterium]
MTITRAHRYGWDFVKLQPRASVFAEAFGSEYRPSGNAKESPVLIKAGVQELGDWEKLADVDASHPDFADQVEAIGLVASNLGPRVPVLQTVFSPLTVAGHLIGSDTEGIVRLLKEQPDVLGPALERIAQALASFSVASVEAGGAGIFFAVSGYASADLLSQEEYERLVLPSDKAVIAGFHSEQAWFNILHLCGPRLNFDLAPAFGLPVVSWSVHEDGNPSLAEGRDRSGLTAMGGLGQKTTLAKGTPEEVLAEGRSALEGTDGRGVILAPGCSVAVSAPAENLAAVGEVVAA